MKLLLDQNISRRLVAPLQQIYPGSDQAAMLKLDKASDLQIWQYAKDHDFVIVTKDGDFEELTHIYGVPPKVLWLRVGNVTNQTVLKLLLEQSEAIIESLTKSDIGCLEVSF